MRSLEYRKCTTTNPSGGSYVAAVGYRTRVIAFPGPPGMHAVPPLVYKAEAYEEGDRFRERVWTCSHAHQTVEESLRCGNEWLARHDDHVSESA